MSNNRIPNQDRWERNFLALEQFVSREGHARVPSSHNELHEGRNVPIGAWVGYMRQRYRQNTLRAERVTRLTNLKGWEWGPLRPGPASNNERDLEVIKLRKEGLSLQSIAEKVGVSRQRVHQITRRSTEV